MYGNLTNARTVSLQKRQHFHGLSTLLPSEHIAEWQKLSLEPTFVKGEWLSVYRHKKVKGAPQFLPFIFLLQLTSRGHTVPSQASVFQQMLADETEIRTINEALLPMTMFLNTGINIQSKQCVQ